MLKRSLFFVVSGRLLASSLTSFYTFHETVPGTYYESGTLFSATQPITMEYLNEDEIWAQKIPPRQKENYLYGAARYDLGMQMEKGWKFGIVDIAEAWLDTNADFLNAYSALKTGTLSLYEKDRRFDVIAKGEYYRAQGLFLQKSFQSGPHTLFLQSRILDGKEYIDAKLNGWIYDDTATDLAFDLELSHRYFKKNLLTQRKTDGYLFKGTGLSNDIAYRFSQDDTLVEAGIKNLFGYMHWYTIPFYEARANSDRYYTGTDGYLHYRPILTGSYSKTKELHQSLPQHRYLFARQRVNDYTFALLAYRFAEHDSAELLVQKECFELGYEPAYDKTEFTYYGDRFILSLTYALLDFKDAHAVSGSFTIYHK